jgi:carbon dioxide concentrating mechanism protein CcmO
MSSLTSIDSNTLAVATDSIGILETLGWTAGMVALDQMAKSANVVLIQAEWNDMLGSVIKIAGSSSDVQSALEAGKIAASSFFPHAKNGNTTILTINRPDEQALRAILSPNEVSALIEQPVVKIPSSNENQLMTSNNSLALGFIETQGFTAVFEAIDTACKSASVEVVGKEKLGGGYVTVVIRGDVAAVNAAIEAAKPRVEGLGKLIACHVIARPCTAALSLLPK